MKMLIDAPSFEDISQDVKDFIDGTILVGHNLPFDYAFLNSEFERADIHSAKTKASLHLKTLKKFIP